jgi:hypothetical protein
MVLESINNGKSPFRDFEKAQKSLNQAKLKTRGSEERIGEDVFEGLSQG